MPQARKHSTAAAASTTAAEPAAAPTTVAVAPTTPPTGKHELERAVKRTADPQPPVGYESPLKKLKKSRLKHKRKLIVTIDELREFISSNGATPSDKCESIRIQARLLWYAPVKLGRTNVLRLYLSEQQAPEPLEQQQREYQAAQQEDEFEANQFLITLSLYEVSPDNPALPAPGSVIAFNPSGLKLYRDCCQVRTSLQAITTVVTAPP